MSSRFGIFAIERKLSGGRMGARRLLVLAALGLVLCGPQLMASSNEPQPDVTVREANGVYTVEARFVVREPADVARAVLTDYEQIPRFMPDVRSSRIVGRGDGVTLVEQEGVARFMMFSKRIRLLLEIREEPGTIRFLDRCGVSFSAYEGAWRIAQEEGGTAITYGLRARPGFDVPEFLLKRLLKRDATRMIENLRAEMAARRPQ